MNRTTAVNSQQKSKHYFKYMIFILMFVEILDTYTTNNLNVVVSDISGEFFPFLADDAAIAFYQLFLAVATLGMFFVVINQYLTDKFGRKLLLVITIFGMGFFSLLISLSINIYMYTIFLFFMYFFFNSDIWVIFINEESPPQKRAFYTNLVLIGGIIGALLIPFFHSIVLDWRGMTYFAIALGIPLSILILFTFKETSKYQEYKNSKKSLEQDRNSFRVNLKIIFASKRKSQYIAILVISLIVGLNNLFILVGEDFLTKSALSKDDVDLIVWIMGLASIIGYLITGIVADKYGRKPLLYLYSILFPISLFIVVFGINLPNIALIVVAIGAGLANLCYWGFRILISIVSLEIVPTETRGTGTGVKSLVAASGVTIGLLISFFITYSSGLALSFIILSSLFLINLPLIYKYLKETKGINLSDIY
ncbi:MAG: MFS transporter [Promethearchaeota archaeon]|nr:MAG: MFS transporter [Candidatus Lokiarchaeota archaeon]